MSEEFILKIKAEDIVREAVVSCRGLADNLSSLPVVDYICSAIFLKMTGLLEQKFRAMTWVMANNNREYRRTFLNSRNFGEFSSLTDKKTVYKDLVEQIFIYRKAPFIINHKDIAKSVACFLVSMFEKTIFDTNLHGELLAFYEVISKQAFNVHKITTATVTHILIPNEVIKDLFEDVIRCRNRLAHNAYVNISVRNDLPELCNRKELDCNNIFMQFFVLLYIDNVFNETYKVYWEEFANL